jgi:hypothetical protein
MMAETPYNQDVCIMRHEVVDTKIASLECEIGTVKEHQAGLHEDIKEVRDLQKQILYAIIGLFGASVLTLIGVLVGRGIDFGVFF